MNNLQKQNLLKWSDNINLTPDPIKTFCELFRYRTSIRKDGKTQYYFNDKFNDPCTMIVPYSVFENLTSLPGRWNWAFVKLVDYWKMPLDEIAQVIKMLAEGDDEFRTNLFVRIYHEDVPLILSKRPFSIFRFLAGLLKRSK